MGLLDYNIEQKPKRALLGANTPRQSFPREGLLGYKREPEQAVTPTGKQSSINPNQQYIDEGKAAALERAGGSKALLSGLTDDDYIEIGRQRIKEQEHGFLGELGAGLGRGALRVAATPAYLADVAGEAVGWEGLERAGEAGAEAVEQYIQESPRLRKSASISGDIRDNPQLWTDPNWYAAIIGEGAPTIASMIIPGMGAARIAKIAGMGAKGVKAARTGGALVAGMGLEAGGAAEDIRQYEKRTGEKVPISKKLQTVMGTGIVAGSLEAVPVFNLFGKTVAKKLIGRIITSMALEGGTEGAQEIVANAFAKAGYDADRDMVGGVIESVVGGVLLGGGMGVMQQTFQERIKNTDPDKVADVLEQAEKEATSQDVQPFKDAVESGQLAKDIKSGAVTSEDMAPAIEGIATQDPALAKQIKGMFVEKETDLTENKRRFEEDPLDAENNAEFLDKYIKFQSTPPHGKRQKTDSSITGDNAIGKDIAEKKKVKEPVKTPVEFVGMSERVGKPSFPIVTELDEGKSTVNYDPEKHEITIKKAEYEKAVEDEKKKPIKTAEEYRRQLAEKKAESEIPVFTNTPQAVAFGEKATPEQIVELKRLQKESADEVFALMKTDPNAAMELASGAAQFYREAIEAKEKEVVTPEVVKPRHKMTLDEKEKKEVAKEPIKFIGTRTRQGKEVPLFEATTGKHRGYQIDYDSELHEITNLDEYEKVIAAKPQPSKPAKAKPLEAVEKEIEGESIVTPAPKKPLSKVRSLRGAISEIGGINFLQYTGELKDLNQYDQKAISRKTGIGIDQAVNELIADGWLDKNTTVESFLEELRTNPKAMLSRDRITADITTKKPHEVSAEEKRLKEEMEREPEAPPEGEYVTLNAEDLPVGKKMTLLEGKTDTGWDIYEIQEKDEFSITLKDGKEITLSPLDKVQVLKKDIKKTEDIEIIDPDGTYVNREKVKTIEKDGLKATYYGTYRKDGAFKAWKTKTEIDKIKKAKGKAGLDLRQEFYGKQAKVEPVDKMKQRGLGLEVEDKTQPGLFEKGKPYEKSKTREATIKETQALSAAERGAAYTQVSLFEKQKTESEFPKVISDRAGSYKSGVKTIIAPQDAAAFAHLNLSKYPQEHLAILVLDKGNNILEVHRHTIGTKRASLADAAVIAGQALHTPKAAQIIMVHNHPSGGGALSNDDKIVFEDTKNVLKGTKVKAQDMIAAGIDNYGSYIEGDNLKIPVVKGKYEFPIMERVFKSRGKGLQNITSSLDVEKIGKEILPDGGLLFLNMANNIVGSMSINDYAKLRVNKISENILKQTETSNTASLIAYNPDIKLSSAAKDNLQLFSNATSLQLFDIIDSEGSHGDMGDLVRKAGTKFFATKAIKPQDTITRKDLREIFTRMKNVVTGQDSKGNFFFRVAGRPRVTIFEVDEVSGYINTSSGQMPVGSYLGNKIELKTGGVGHTADIDTAYHEFFHYLSGAGILTGNDIKALDTAIGKATVTEEDRATYVGDRLAVWQSEKNTRIKRILKKISDFMDTIWEFVSRTRTAESVIRDIESGRILKEKKEVLTGVNEFAQAVSFSLKKAAKAVTDNPNFVKWFGGSKVLNEKGEPLVVYHGTSGDFSIFEKEKIGTRYPQDIVEDAFWFSESSHGANLFAREFGGNVMPTYLSLKNPKIIDAAQKVSPDLYFKRDGKTVFDIRYIKRHTVIEAKADGYDGVVFKNAYDGTPASGDIYVAFEPTQIKSIYNTGAYGLTEPDIRYQQTADRFYSQVVKTVQDKMPAKMPASDVMNWLRKQPGIKAAELEWMDVEAMLEDKKVVGRDELVGLLKESQVIVEEVVKGKGLDIKKIGETQYKFDNLIKEADALVEKYPRKTRPKEIQEKIDAIGNKVNKIHDDWAGRYDFVDRKDLIEDTTKFASYQLEGKKENYRELLFRLPGMERFQSQHWEEPNVFAHVRVNERTDADGEKILFIEEIQSDWELSIRKGERVPDMPFKKNWQEVVMKRIIRMAAEQGIDKISWTTGQQQADRYDLSKKVKSVYYNPSKKLLFAMDKDGGMPISEKVEPEGIEAYIGKEPAKRLLSSEVNKDGEHYIGGKDLKVGGQWTYALYDRMIPQYLKKFGKKYKAEVGTTEINNKQQPSFTITPALKRAALFEGMPLFQMAGKKAATEGVDYKELLKEYKEEAKVYPEKAGQPSFQETLEPITDEDYTSNRKARKDIKASTVTGIRRVKAEMAEGIDKYLGSISTRLGNVSLKLKAKLRKLDFDTNTKFASDIKAVEPLLRKAKKMSRDDFADWDYARKNSDIVKINELVSKYDMQKEYAAYRETLDKTRKEGLDVGLDIGEIEEYAPRILKDSRGFLTAIGKAEEWPIYSRRLQERAVELGVSVESMPFDMKADIISNMILGGWTGLGGVPATKQRQLKKIPAYLNRYYMDSDAALMQHLYGMRKLIEARKFFGKIPEKVAEMRKRLYAAQSKVREINNLLKGELTKEETDKLKKRLNKHLSLGKQYTEYLSRYALQRDYTENIGAYVIELIDKKEIDPKHERIVNEILNARFHEKGTRGLIQAYKNISYIDTMGSPISALTQIGDMAWAAYEGGLIRALKYAYKAARGKSRITKEDVGVERIAQEFADSGTLGNAVSKVFKIVGLEKIDTIGKEALLNTTLEKYQKQAKNNPLKLKREIRPIFEGETDSVIEDLVNNEISDNVKLLTYSRLLDFQPVGLSEMPQKYLDAGNGRLFYMLKTFTIKVFDVFRNESYNKIKTGNRAEKIEGMKNLVRLSLFFVLANAGADELKDFVLGRKTDFEDRVTDNILRLFGVSKYLTWRARTEGLPSALARQILPPFKFLDAAYKDIITAGDEKGLEMLGSVPIGGKLAYWHLGRGVSKREDLWNRRLRKYKAKLNKVSDGLEKSKNKIAFRQEHRKELLELRKVNRLQGRINLYRKRINKIKSRPESSARKKEIQKLEKIRTEMIKTYLAKK